MCFFGVFLVKTSMVKKKFCHGCQIVESMAMSNLEIHPVTGKVKSEPQGRTFFLFFCDLFLCQSGVTYKSFDLVNSGEDASGSIVNILRFLVEHFTYTWICLPEP